MILDDPIVQEVRRCREDLAARFNHDSQEIVTELRRSDQQMAAEKGRNNGDSKHALGCRKGTEGVGWRGK